MRRRSLKLFGILLLCVFVGGCSTESYDYDDELNTEDNNMNIDIEEKDDEDIDMPVDDTKETLVEVINDSSLEQAEQMDPDPIETIKQQDFMNPEGFIEQGKKKTAGMVVNTSEFSQYILDELFYVNELDQDVINRITGKSYKEGADIPYGDLRYIRLLHIGFDGQSYIGEMIVNKAIAEDVIDIFKELYSIEYPIEKMLLIDDYDADDLKSMADNNSSAFNYRLIEGTSRRSVHSDGLAIDINPLYNPYVRTRDGKMEVLPENALEHVDRSRENIYYIRKDDPLYKAFTSRGFTWGGEWKNSKDYQHFEKKLAD